MNDLPDRISDVIIFAGVAHSGLSTPLFAYWAAIFALLTAYVGLFGQALGVQREFSGMMSKPWRMVALQVGAWAALLLGRPAPLTAALWVVLAGCVQTIAVRLARIRRALLAKKEA